MGLNFFIFFLKKENEEIVLERHVSQTPQLFSDISGASLWKEESVWQVFAWLRSAKSATDKF